jgi:hypothetical protein
VSSNASGSVRVLVRRPSLRRKRISFI